MSDDTKCKSIAGMIEALEILSKYSKNGKQTKYFLDAEHDVIYSHIDSEEISENAKDGRRLLELGWHKNTEFECWAYFT